ncbi:MAG TPA: nitroreductase family deazaflavin-dependent oxidoreductase [Solirubrobacteraceae bacterium]|nr:nitroreductase family deazaflavin-dependent oxidoreductase [Solirubrobacteraceae bacterium]
MSLEPGLAGEDYAYLTTTGRRTGRPREIEIWFALRGRTVFLMAGGGDGAQWVRNLRADPGVRVRVGDQRRRARARIVGDPEEDRAARDLLVGKYAPRSGGDLENWGRTGLPVALDLEGPG